MISSLSNGNINIIQIVRYFVIFIDETTKYKAQTWYTIDTLKSDIEIVFICM